jgi:hypothetical protein
MDNNGEPAAARKLPSKKRDGDISGAEEDDGDKKSAAWSSQDSDESSSPEAREQLEEALDLIPDEEKAAYLEAIETAPQVIEDESNPAWFIRHERCNFWAAASRLVTYWKERKALFGDRAFRPLKLLTGEGALNEADITVLRLRWLVMLPKDGVGRSVLYFAKAIITSEENSELIFESKCRVSFFWLSILSENIASQTDGFVFIIRGSPTNGDVPVTNGGGWNEGLRGAKSFFGLIRNAMPARMKTVHFTCSLPKAGRKVFLKLVYGIVIKRHGKFFEDVGVMHVGESEHMCDKLQAHCLKPEGLPETLGGMLKFEALVQWVFAENPNWTKCIPDEASLDLPLVLSMDAPTLAAGENAVTNSECSGSTNSVQNNPVNALMKNAEIFDKNGKKGPDVAAHGYLELDEALELIPKEEKAAYREAVERVPDLGCLELEEALELIPMEEKAAYREAVKRVPDLVDSESDDFRFLWYEKYNISAAARRLVSYWECRKELFGERAFLPMTQLENGALSKGDVAVLQTGFLALLPDDTDGCAVVCYDGSRLGPSVEDPDGMSRLRCLFYTMSVVSEKQQACVDGFVGIEIAHELSFEQSKGHFFELAEKVLPVHLKALHLVPSPQATAGTKQFFRTIVPATLKLLGATAYRRVHVQTGKSKGEILEKLEACGLFSEGLPECVGGTWTYANFVEWQAERRHVEEEIANFADWQTEKRHVDKKIHLPRAPASTIGQHFSLPGAICVDGISERTLSETGGVERGAEPILAVPSPLSLVRGQHYVQPGAFSVNETDTQPRENTQGQYLAEANLVWEPVLVFGEPLEEPEAYWSQPKVRRRAFFLFLLGIGLVVAVGVYF